LAYNNALNTARFAHWTRKSYAFARLLANRYMPNLLGAAQ